MDTNIQIPTNINDVIKNAVRYERNFDFKKWLVNRSNVLYKLAEIVNEEDEISAKYLFISSKIYGYHANVLDRFMNLFQTGGINFISSPVFDIQYISPKVEIICNNDEFGQALDYIKDLGIFVPLVDIEISDKIDDKLLISKIGYWKYVFTIAFQFTISTLIIYALNHIVHNIFYYTHDKWPDQGPAWPIDIHNILHIKMNPIAYCSNCGLSYSDMSGIKQCSCGAEKNALKKWPKNTWEY